MEDALKRLKQRLKAAHLEAGEVSMRELSKRCHGAVSHTTAHQVIRGEGLPSWRSLEPVVAALGENVEEFKDLWLQARRKSDGHLHVPELNLAYRPRMDPETSGLINLARAYLARNEQGKATSILCSYLDSRKYVPPTIAIYLYSNFAHGLPNLKEKYEKYVESYLNHGEVLEIEYSATAHWLSQTACDRHNYARALAFVQRAIQIDPTDPWHWRLHGRILIEMGRYKEAEEVLLATHEVDNETDFWYSDLAKLLKLTRQFEKLQNFLQVEYERASAGALSDLFENYIDCLLMRGKNNEALSVARAAVERESEEYYASAALIALSRVLCHQGDFEDARNVIKSSPLYGHTRNLQIEYGNILIRGGSVENGAAILQEIYQKDSD